MKKIYLLLSLFLLGFIALNAQSFSISTDSVHVIRPYQSSADTTNSINVTNLTTNPLS